jgi:hypothetical protein
LHEAEDGLIARRRDAGRERELIAREGLAVEDEH